MTRPLFGRRQFLALAGVAVTRAALSNRVGSLLAASSRPASGRPNFVVIFCDDLGYGDIGCFGADKHHTPNLDRMAAEGRRFTSFYVSSGVCTPSRSSLMTGCYPRRVNMHQNEANLCVLFPVNRKGLNPDEVTMAEVLKRQGYATACIGKWHLGDQPAFLPTKQGFDTYFGIPYSNDMGTTQGPDRPPLPLLRDEEVIEAPADQNTLTRRYTDEVIRFMREHRDEPFFVYLPHTMPHNPAHASDEFRDTSDNGRYGDAVEEIDWSVGQILAALKALDLDDKTLVLFTSDNGAASRWGGSNGPLRGWKGSTWEGGMREPCIVRWPGHVPAGTACDELACTMDLLPTFARLAGTTEPQDRIIDGKDIWPLISGRADAKSPHQAFYYYQMDQLQAVRSGRWKLHLSLKPKKRNWGQPEPEAPLQLFDLKSDIGETRDVSDDHPDVVSRLMALAEEAREDLGDVDRPGRNQRPAALVDAPKPLLKASR